MCRKGRCHEVQWQQDLATLALPWLQYAIGNWENITLKHKPDHLDQALLFKDSHIEVLLHRFDDSGMQSCIHNHRASFVSLCLTGSYTESKWWVDHQAVGSFTEWHR